MGNWVSFVYRDFFDVPRAIIVRRDHGLIFMSSRFDSEKDDYENSYLLYWLPLETNLDGTWDGLESQAIRPLGNVRVLDVCFDGTRRKYIDVDSLGIELP